MAQIYTGAKGSGTVLDSKYLRVADPSIQMMMAEIETGNTTTNSPAETINQLFDAYEKEVVRKDGTPVHVKYSNVKFTQGGLSSDASEFRAKYGKMPMEVSRGWNVKNMDYSVEDILQAENDDINLLEQGLDTIKDIRMTYRNAFLPFERLIALLTGASFYEEIPTLAAPTDVYDRTWGFARGEDFTGLLQPSAKNKNINNYRAIKDTVDGIISEEDIKDIVKNIKASKTYKNGDIFALADPSVVSTLSTNFYKADENKDLGISEYLDNVTILGVTFIGTNLMSEDFIVFFDAGYTKDLILKGVNKAERQRGLAFVFPETENKQFIYPTNLEEFNGSKTRIFPVEWYMPHRLAGAVLDITNAEATGIMGVTGETALNNFIKDVKSSYSNFKG